MREIVNEQKDELEDLPVPVWDWEKLGFKSEEEFKTYIYFQRVENSEFKNSYKSSSYNLEDLL